MKEEVIALLGNITWDVVDVPNDVYFLNGFVLLKDETINRYKIRLYCRKVQPKIWIDYLDSFATVAKMNFGQGYFFTCRIEGLEDVSTRYWKCIYR